MDTKGIASTMYKLKSKNTTIVSGTHPRTLKQVIGSVLGKAIFVPTHPRLLYEKKGGTNSYTLSDNRRGCIAQLCTGGRQGTRLVTRGESGNHTLGNHGFRNLEIRARKRATRPLTPLTHSITQEESERVTHSGKRTHTYTHSRVYTRK